MNHWEVQPLSPHSQSERCSETECLPLSLSVSLGILGINEAVERGDTAQTLAALRSPDVGLYGVTPECDQAYQADLAVLKKSKQDEGEQTERAQNTDTHAPHTRTHS